DQNRCCEDARETKVLPGQDPKCGPCLAGPTGEEQREHDDVVDIGGDKQTNRPQETSYHFLFTSPVAHPGTSHAESIHGAFSSAARVVSSSEFNAWTRWASTIS